MPHTYPSYVRRAFGILLSGLSLGCGSDLVLPETPAPEQTVALTKVAGDTQRGAVGTTLTQALVVSVLTENQEPAPGQQVIFELADPAAGSVTPTTATTNSDGQAEAQWTLGTVPGPYTATARLAGTESSDQVAQFSALATAGPPDAVSPTVPLSQAGRQGQAVATAPQVRVLDQFGNPVPDVAVSWQVVFGGGQVSASSTTDADGLASTSWILGDRVGVHKLTASVEGIQGPPVTFTATVLF